VSGKIPPPPATVAAALADGAVLKTSATTRLEGRETARIVGNDLDDTDVVRDLIAFSLFTWRRARADDDVPDGASRQGWFADPELGSRLWLLRGRKITTETLADARQYAEEALAWMVDRAILASVTATAQRSAEVREGIEIAIDYRRPDGPVETVRYARLWED